MSDKENKDLEGKLNDFLKDDESTNNCPNGVCIIKDNSGGLVEVVNKKLLTNDGRQLLI
jgi:hypothetical protein